ncbi:hypothetical protein ACIPYS_26525 [Kitasatospora sp. NPDC089913]|uniref:hypothetical protein n=1 Tax=Kitasatospora sp. NPDC089913 TaxID=3364080 RepID=UPI0037FF20F6
MPRRRRAVDPAAPAAVRELALRLREVAEAAGFPTNSGLAAASGLGETVVGEVLRGIRAPTTGTLGKLLTACDIAPDRSWQTMRSRAQAADQQNRARTAEADRQAAARREVTGTHRSAAELARRHLLLRGRAHLGADGDLPSVGSVRDRALLRIHPAPPVRGYRGDVVLDPELPSYVERDRDLELRAELGRARDHGGLVLLQGPSAAGKSRAAAEAMWSCLPGWQLLIPVVSADLAPLADPRFDLSRTVVWLSDLQLHLGPGGAHVHAFDRLLAHPGRPVLLATIRSSERAALRGDGEEAGPHDGQQRAVATAGDLPMVQDLLGRARTVVLERLFTAAELGRAGRLDGDPRIATALPGTNRFGLAELLAAGPELRDLLAAHTGDADGQFVGAALVHAAVDCVRAGWNRPVPVELLRGLVPQYVPAELRGDVTAESFDTAVAWSTRRRRGYSRLLIPSVDDRRALSAFDYLVDDAQAQHGRAVPEAVWHALVPAADPETALTLGERALNALAGSAAEAALRKALDSEVADVAADAARRLGRLHLDRGEASPAEAVLRRAERSSGWRDDLNAYLVDCGRYDEVLDRWIADTDVTGPRREPDGLFAALTACARWTDLERLLLARNSNGPARQTLNAELRAVKRLRWSDPGQRLTLPFPAVVLRNTSPNGSSSWQWWRRRIASLSQPAHRRPATEHAEGRLDAQDPFASEKERLVRSAAEWDHGRSLYGWSHLLFFLSSHGRRDELEPLLHEALADGAMGVADVLERRRAIARRIAAPVLPPVPDDGEDFSPALAREFGNVSEHLDPRPTEQLDRHLAAMFHELHPGPAARDFTEAEAEQEARRTGHDLPVLEYFRRAGRWHELLDRCRPFPTIVPWPHLELGYHVLAHVRLGRWPEAEAVARHAFEAGESSLGPVLAETLLHRPDGPAQAQRLLHRLIGTAPRRPVNRLIRLLLDTGRTEDTERAIGLVRRHGEVAPPPCGQVTAALMALHRLPAMEPVCRELIHNERWEDKRASGWEESTQGMWTALAAHYDALAGPDRADDELRQAVDDGDLGARHVLARRLHRAGDDNGALGLLDRIDSAGWNRRLDAVLCGALRVRLLHHRQQHDEAALDLLLTADPLLLRRLGDLDPALNAPEISDVLWCVRAAVPDLEPGYRWQYHHLRRAVGEPE